MDPDKTMRYQYAAIFNPFQPTAWWKTLQLYLRHQMPQFRSTKSALQSPGKKKHIDIRMGLVMLGCELQSIGFGRSKI